MNKEKQIKTGAFYTPKHIVDEAHKMISENLGADWKEKYVVWDPAWGTGNLTRDYKFKELYVSTLEQCDIDTANQMGYNPEAIKFQFDFLNDDDSKLPQSLQDAINSGKEILFLINPPYVANTGFHLDNKNLTKTKTRLEMEKLKIKQASKNLFSQFIFKISEYKKINKNILMVVMCPPIYLSGSSFKNFRKYFFDIFGFETGFLFQASNFEGLSNDWGISCSLYKEPNGKKNYFEFHIYEKPPDEAYPGAKTK